VTFLESTRSGDRIASEALRDSSAAVVDWQTETISHPFGTPTTESIQRIRGVALAAGERRAFTAIAKTVRSIRHFPPVSALPMEIQAMADAALPWRVEPEVYRSGLHGSLPPDLRAPRLYEVEDLPDDRARIWIEDVVSDPIVWDTETYAAAAFAFGRLAGRYPAAAIPWTFTPMTWDLHRYLETRVGPAVIPVLADDATWSHPLIRAEVDEHLRADLWSLWERGHELASLADGQPRTLCHGDACPQNLLMDASPGRFVAIDWGLAGTAVVGMDLVQLVAGRVDSGELTAEKVEDLMGITLDPFLSGLALEGMEVRRSDLDLAVDVSLVVRCAFTALPVERLAGLAMQPNADRVVRQRAAWCRFLVDRGRRLLGE
jgi:Phosphotransferase enzyme family